MPSAPRSPARAVQALTCDRASLSCNALGSGRQIREVLEWCGRRGTFLPGRHAESDGEADILITTSLVVLSERVFLDECGVCLSAQLIRPQGCRRVSVGSEMQSSKNARVTYHVPVTGLSRSCRRNHS